MSVPKWLGRVCIVGGRFPLKLALHGAQPDAHQPTIPGPTPDLDRLCESYPHLPCFSVDRDPSPESGSPGCSGSSTMADSGRSPHQDTDACESSRGGGGSNDGDTGACNLCVDLVALARALRPDLARAPQISLSRLVALVGDRCEGPARTVWAVAPPTP